MLFFREINMDPYKHAAFDHTTLMLSISQYLISFLTELWNMNVTVFDTRRFMIFHRTTHKTL